jgi:hypothetical protein
VSPVARRLALVAVGLGVAAGLLEAGLRLTGRAVRPQAAIFALDERGTLGLAACVRDRVRRPDGRVTEVATDAAGLRSDRGCTEPPATDTLVLGDSQVFGLGVSLDETFAARLGALDGGVPDFAIPDALAWGERLLARRSLVGVRRVIVVLNQSNDFDDGLRTSAARNDVRSGYLLRRDRLATRGAALWGTPLAHSALFYTLWGRLVAPPADPPGDWLVNPAAVVPLARDLGRAVRAFADAHPSIAVTLAWLPADLATSPENAAESVLYRAGDPVSLALWQDTRLRDAVGEGWAAPLVDLGPALATPASFLAHDFHLSESGHARVASLLLTHTDGR